MTFKDGIFVEISMFKLDQSILHIDSNGEEKVTKCTIAELPETIFNLSKETKKDIVLLAGNRDYANKIIAKIKDKEITEHSYSKLKFICEGENL